MAELTTNELAERAGVCRQTIDKARLSGKIKGRKVRGTFFFPEECVLAFGSGRDVVARSAPQRRASVSASVAIEPIPQPFLTDPKYKIESPPEQSEIFQQAMVAKARQEIARADLLEMDRDERAGRLLPKEEYERKLYALGTTIRVKLEALPANLAGELAGMDDPKEISFLLTRAIANCLIETSNEIKQLEEK